MTLDAPVCAVILAGGQSIRMGTDKAVIKLEGERLIDILIHRFSPKTQRIFLSARQDYGTGLRFIRDDPDAPAGPVGAIFSVASKLVETQPGVAGFVTVPVDAPFAPPDLVQRLAAPGMCTVAQDDQRMHPTFAYWRCDAVNAVRAGHDAGERAPSLHWLAEQCGAQAVRWDDPTLFLNINQPEDLARAATNSKAGV